MLDSWHQLPICAGSWMGVTAAYNFTRKHIKHLAEDRDLSIDIAAAEQLSLPVRFLTQSRQSPAR